MAQQTRTALAADMIWGLWQAGNVTSDLHPDLKPATRREGYDIQAIFDNLSTRPSVGWKIAATSVAGQSHIGVDGPIAGRIFSERLLPDGGVSSLASNRMRVAEPEFAFRFGRDLTPRAHAYTVDDVMAAVDSLHLAIEIPDSRFADFANVGGPTLIADNACAHELVLGGRVDADWRSLDLSQHRVVATMPRTGTRDGIGKNVLGDPRTALTWIVNELSGLGITVQKSTFVTTGTCMTPLAITEGDKVFADFGPLGSISVAFL